MKFVVYRYCMLTKWSYERARQAVHHSHCKDKKHPRILHSKWELPKNSLPHTLRFSLRPKNWITEQNYELLI